MKEEIIQDHSGDDVWDCGSPLYDSYELASLSHVIDRHMMILPSLVTCESRKLKEEEEEEEEEAVMIADGGAPALSGSSNSSPKELMKKKKKKAGGTSCVGVSFWWSNWRKKRICDHGDVDGIDEEEEEEGDDGKKKGKKKVMKFSNGICRAYHRISSLRK